MERYWRFKENDESLLLIHFHVLWCFFIWGLKELFDKCGFLFFAFLCASIRFVYFFVKTNRPADMLKILTLSLKILYSFVRIIILFFVVMFCLLILLLLWLAVFLFLNFHGQKLTIFINSKT